MSSDDTAPEAAPAVDAPVAAPADDQPQPQAQQQSSGGAAGGRGGRGRGRSNNNTGRGGRSGSGGRGRGRGQSNNGRGGGDGAPVSIAPTSGVPYGHVPAYLPGSSSVVEDLDQLLLMVLRDGRHLVGVSKRLWRIVYVVDVAR